MIIRTVSISVSAPRDLVFNFLADIENLPRWAGDYCERITLERGRWWALTVEGEQVIAIETNADAGVIDLHAGPAPDRLNPFPIRVLPLSARRTLVNLTLIEAPDQTLETFERRYQALLLAARGLRRRFGGGELHPPVAAPQLTELGVN
ncbi:MAG TPA: hypothetical protein VFJ90_13595 [Candidatus Didemnitutus sp.]|nr:hypothetical protein [Candidatus Didemnitutus sp.]